MRSDEISQCYLIRSCEICASAVQIALTVSILSNESLHVSRNLVRSRHLSNRLPRIRTEDIGGAPVKPKVELRCSVVFDAPRGASDIPHDAALRPLSQSVITAAGGERETSVAMSHASVEAR